MQNELFNPPIVVNKIPNALLWIECYHEEKNSYNLLGPYVHSDQDMELAVKEMAREINDKENFPDHYVRMRMRELWDNAKDGNIPYLQIPRDGQPEYVWTMIYGESETPAWNIVKYLDKDDKKYLWSIYERTLPSDPAVIKEKDKTLLDALTRDELVDPDGRLRLEYSNNKIHSHITLNEALIDFCGQLHEDEDTGLERFPITVDTKEMINGSSVIWTQRGDEVVKLLMLTRHEITEEGRSNTMDPYCRVRETENEGEYEEVDKDEIRYPWGCMLRTLRSRLM